jgi:hypothetical protein
MKNTEQPLVSPLLQRQQVRRPLAVAVSAACGVVGSMSISAPALSQGLEEVLVTATKSRRERSGYPDVRVSVMGEAQLTDLNITDMEDYLMMLPNVGFISLGQAPVAFTSAVFRAVVRACLAPTRRSPFIWMSSP